LKRKVWLIKPWPFIESWIIYTKTGSGEQSIMFEKTQSKRVADIVVRTGAGGMTQPRTDTPYHLPDAPEPAATRKRRERVERRRLEAVRARLL
jgi:hypothetical protein